VVISTLGWILIGVAAWLVVALVVGVVIGRTIRNRDRQVPSDPAAPITGIPAPTTAQDHPDRRLPRVVGRGTRRRS
jgi:hypothetical protein